MATSERDAARRSSHYLKYLVYYPRGGYILAGNEKTRPSFFEKKKKKKKKILESSLFLSFFLFLFCSILKILFILPVPPFFLCRFTHSLSPRKII